MVGQGPVGPATGWMRHMPTHDTEGDGHGAGAAGTNGVAAAPMNGSAPAHPHGIAAPAPGLDPVELGYSSSDSDREAHFQQTAGDQPSGAAAAHSDAASRPAGAAVAPHSQRHMDGAESTLDRARDKARSQKDEVKRQFEDRRTRLKVSISRSQGALPALP